MSMGVGNLRTPHPLYETQQVYTVGSNKKWYLEQQLAYLIFPFGSSFMKWCELPQVNSIDIGIVFD